MDTNFRTTLQFSFTQMNAAVIVVAAGYPVETVRRPGSRRVIFYADDLPAIHDLIDRYERNEVFDLPAKEILEIRTDLAQRAKRLAMEGV